MSKPKRRLPRYKREDPVLREREARKDAGIPVDAIKANLSEQAHHNSYSGVPLYYRDQEFTCADCGKPQVWTASQQQWWYGVAKGSIYSRAKRCRACRTALRAAQAGKPCKSPKDKTQHVN